MSEYEKFIERYSNAFVPGFFAGLALDLGYGFVDPLLQHSFTLEHVAENLIAARLISFAPYVMAEIGDALSTAIFLSKERKKGTPRNKLHLAEGNEYHSQTIQMWHEGKKAKAIARGVGQKAVHAIPAILFPEVSLGTVSATPVLLVNNLRR